MNSLHKYCVTLVVALLTAGTLNLFAQSTPNQRIHRNAQERQTAKLKDVRLEGELGTRFKAATRNILVTRQDVFSLDSFRSSALSVPGALWWDWPGDQIGRWLSVVHVASALGLEPPAVSRAAVLDFVLPLQRPEGCFGTEPPESTDVRVVSGNAFGLRGLVDTYEDTRDERVLAAARRMAGYFEANFDYYKERGRLGTMYEFYGHSVGGLMRLYEVAGDQSALDLAQRISDHAGLSQHTHSSLSMYRGLVDLYNVTGNRDTLRRITDYLTWVRGSRIVTGGIPENMPLWNQDEGCGLADYVQLNLMVFAATGDDAYLEDAEYTMVNHFFMNQFHTGGFGTLSFGTPGIVGGKTWQGWGGKFGSETLGCCSLWGQWGLGKVAQFIFTRHHDALEVNLYPSAEVEFPDLDMKLSMKSDFPRMRQASLTLNTKRTEPLELRLRVPRWAEAMEVDVNGVKVDAKRDGGRLVVRRVWRSGDVVRMPFKSPLRLVRWPLADSPNAAIFDGPLCMGLSSADRDLTTELSVVTTPSGELALGSNGQPQFTAKGKPVALRLHPIEENWQSPDVFEPQQFRVLFDVPAK
jgi:hypothetical protein